MSGRLTDEARPFSSVKSSESSGAAEAARTTDDDHDDEEEAAAPASLAQPDPAAAAEPSMFAFVQSTPASEPAVVADSPAAGISQPAADSTPAAASGAADALVTQQGELDRLRQQLEAKEEEMQMAVDNDDFDAATRLQDEVDALSDAIAAMGG